MYWYYGFSLRCDSCLEFIRVQAECIGFDICDNGSCAHVSNGKDCSLDKLAYFTGYSKYHLAHRFQAVTGCTIGSYLRKVRMDYISKALELGLKKKEIAWELGFSTLSNFLRWMDSGKEQGGDKKIPQP